MANNTAPTPPVTENTEETTSLDTVLTILRRYWFIIILAALAGGTAAYYLAGKQNYIYQKTASVLMRDAKTGSDASSERIMAELNIDPNAANLANESLVLKSTALMNKVVEDLSLNTSYWQKKDFRELDLYHATPLLVHFEQIDKQRACTLNITPLDEKRFMLGHPNDQGELILLEGFYGKPLTLPFATISVHPTSLMTDAWNGKTVIVRHSPVLETANALLRGLTITRPDSKESSLLEMTLTSSNPQKAEDTLNHLIQVYNQISKDKRNKASLKTKIFIRERLKELGASLSDVDKKLTEFKTKSDIVKDADTTMSADFSTSQALEKEIFDLETQIKLASTLADNLKESERKQGLISVETGLPDSGIARQIEHYNEAYLEYQKIAGSAGSQNPIAVSLRERMNSTRAAANKALSNYRSNLDLKLNQLIEKRNSLTERLTETAIKEQEIIPLIREHKVKEELYLMLLSKEQENALAMAVTESNARVLETAHGPNIPISPKTIKYVAGGTAGGALLSILAFMGAAMLNNKVNNKHDLPAANRQPVIAELPQMSKKESKNTKLFIQDEHSVIAECFHILRNNVDSMLPRPEQGGHVILVTSTLPGEGKTFTSANLAAAFAYAGKKVLLIDGDFRKSSLTRRLGGSGRKGLTSILLQQNPDTTGIIRPLGENSRGMDILYTGPMVPNPVTLLSHPLLGHILGILKKQYDAVIIDAPPYGILADTAILASLSDITLYAVRSGKIDKRYLFQIQQLADQGKLPNMAYIINGVNFKSASYSYYGYGYGYQYGYGTKEPQQTSRKQNK